jgi:hypothetical protein
VAWRLGVIHCECGKTMRLTPETLERLDEQADARARRSRAYSALLLNIGRYSRARGHDGRR